jgi:hypothetical protein
LESRASLKGPGGRDLPYPRSTNRPGGRTPFEAGGTRKRCGSGPPCSSVMEDELRRPSALFRKQVAPSPVFGSTPTSSSMEGELARRPGLFAKECDDESRWGSGPPPSASTAKPCRLRVRSSTSNASTATTVLRVRSVRCAQMLAARHKMSDTFWSRKSFPGALPTAEGAAPTFLPVPTYVSR